MANRVATIGLNWLAFGRDPTPDQNPPYVFSYRSKAVFQSHA